MRKLINNVMLFGIAMQLFSFAPQSFAADYTDNLIGAKLPYFKLQDVRNATKTLTPNSLKGKVSLLNFWASWCSACKREHPMMMKIHKKYGVPIYGIAYKDTRNGILQALSKRGNPYELVGNDVTGKYAHAYDIYGTPETFIVDKNGRIVYRFAGVITEKDWTQTLYPIVKRYS